MISCFSWAASDDIVCCVVLCYIPAPQKRSKQVCTKCDNLFSSPVWFIQTKQMCFTFQRKLHFLYSQSERYFEDTTKPLDVENTSVIRETDWTLLCYNSLNI